MKETFAVHTLLRGRREAAAAETERLFPGV